MLFVDQPIGTGFSVAGTQQESSYERMCIAIRHQTGNRILTVDIAMAMLVLMALTPPFWHMHSSRHVRQPSHTCVGAGHFAFKGLEHRM